MFRAFFLGAFALSGSQATFCGWNGTACSPDVDMTAVGTVCAGVDMEVVMKCGAPPNCGEGCADAGDGLSACIPEGSSVCEVLPCTFALVPLLAGALACGFSTDQATCEAVADPSDSMPDTSTLLGMAGCSGGTTPTFSSDCIKCANDFFAAGGCDEDSAKPSEECKECGAAAMAVCAGGKPLENAESAESAGFAVGPSVLAMATVAAFIML